MKIAYHTQLRKDLAKAKTKLKLAEIKIQNPSKIDEDFMNNYRIVNECRLQVATIKSRIANIKNTNVVLPSHELPKVL